MSTNFYLSHIPTEDDINKIHEAVNSRDFDKARELIGESVRMIHIGKRVHKWQFIFDLHRNKPCAEYEDGMNIDTEEFCLEKAREYIKDMLSDSWEVTDDNNRHLTADEFWNEINDYLYHDENHMDEEDYFRKYPHEMYRTIGSMAKSKDGLLYDTVWFA